MEDLMSGDDRIRIWGVTVGRWQAIGALAGIAAVVVALIPPLGSEGGTAPSPTTPAPPSRSASAPVPTGSGHVTQASISKVAYLAQAERMCLESRQGVATPPDRTGNPQAFGRWLRDIAASNGNLFDKLIGITRPAADEEKLDGVYAQRQHANDLYLRSADAYGNSEPATGEQFLDAAMRTEADFRERARAYGFDICVGSDTPGR
jgi:hypothetical protein